jgi:lipoyl(octanoyl) transferase
MTTQARRAIEVRWLGRVRYGDALALQEQLVLRRIQGEVGDTLLLLEHEPVITLGRGAKATNILVAPEARAERGVELFETGRGGDVTYHAPGQLVAYPIFDLKPDRLDVRRYVRDLGEIMVATAADYGVETYYWPEHVGIWTCAEPTRKVGAIGVRISKWVTMHGFALNISTDLAGFEMIVPCGIQHLGVTSLEKEGVVPTPSVEDVAKRVARHFAATFDATLSIS